MKTPLHLAIAAMFVCLFTACATGPRFTAAAPPAPDKARIYLYRKSSMVGAAGYDKVYLNDGFFTTMRSGGYATTEVPPGTAIFYLNPRAAYIGVGMLWTALSNLDKSKYEKLRLEAEAGKTYYVNLYIDSPISHGLRLVDESRAAKEISDLSLCKTGEE